MGRTAAAAAAGEPPPGSLSSQLALQSQFLDPWGQEVNHSVLNSLLGPTRLNLFFFPLVRVASEEDRERKEKASYEK